MTEDVGTEKMQQDAQEVYDSVYGKVLELGYPREVAIAVAMTSSTRLIEVTE